MQMVSAPGMMVAWGYSGMRPKQARLEPWTSAFQKKNQICPVCSPGGKLDGWALVKNRCFWMEIQDFTSSCHKYIPTPP